MLPIHHYCEGFLGAWYALWCISVFGHLLHYHSTGVPVAWMLTSSGTEAIIQYFLNFIKVQNLEIMPAIVMNDHDQVQMTVIKAIYLECTLLLCWWYVLCAMQSHF